MAARKAESEELLKRPLYVFDLPDELLATLAAKTTGGQAPSQINDSPDQTTTLEQAAFEVSNTTSCSLCQVSFSTLTEQREHIKSDHHRYNLKARLRGNESLNEADFNRAIGELDESISGSDSESTDNEEDGDNTTNDTLVALLKRQAKLSTPEPEQLVPAQGLSRGLGNQPLLWFLSPLISPKTYLGIYRALFTRAEQEDSTKLMASLQSKQVKSLVRNSGQTTQTPTASNKSASHYFLCMIGGGHFAAMIVSAVSEVHRVAGGMEERKPIVLAQKSFHRYTTRRKQGGAQSANDAAKGAAHSAGSSLRRYNEAALEKEIRELLKEWKQLIDTSELLFVRAVGTTNRKILFGPYDGQILKQSDTRLRGFPFSTRRATQSELIKAFAELTRVKISHIDESFSQGLGRTKEEIPKPSKASLPKQKAKISKEEEEAMLHTSQIQALIRRSKIPALLSYLANNNLTPSFKFHSSASLPIHRCPTPLHLAAHSNAPAIVTALITKANADPTMLNGEGQSAFDLAGDRPTRDAFRIARHELGEKAWDWETAHIPSAISKQDFDGQMERDRKVAEQAEAQRRREALERLRKEDLKKTVQQRKPPGRTLASFEKTAAEKREEETRGMTPEMRARLERERRARAAEERIRRLQADKG